MKFRACALAGLLLSTPASAQWSEQTRSTEAASCVEACDAGNPTHHDLCVTGCRCILERPRRRSFLIMIRLQHRDSG